jgi:hypothetical protein
LDEEQEEKGAQWNLRVIMKHPAWHRTPKRSFHQAYYKVTWIELEFQE